MLIRNETHFNCFLPMPRANLLPAAASLLFKFGQFLVCSRPTSCVPDASVENLLSATHSWLIACARWRSWACVCFLWTCWRIACRAVYVQYLITAIAIMYIGRSSSGTSAVTPYTNICRSLFYALSRCMRLSVSMCVCGCAKSSISQNALFNCKKRELYCPNEALIAVHMHARDHAVLNHGGCVNSFFIWHSVLYFYLACLL